MEEFILNDQKVRKIVEHYVEAELKDKIDDSEARHDPQYSLLTRWETADLKDQWWLVEFKSLAYSRTFIIRFSFSEFLNSAQIEHFELAGRKLYQDWQLNYICGKDDEEEDDEDA